MNDKLDIPGFELFEGLNSVQMDKIALVCAKKSYSQDEAIFEEGDNGDYLFLLSSGNVKVFKCISPQLDEALIYLGAGDLFGEMSFIQ